MSQDAMEPAKTYTKVERKDKTSVYACNLCSTESTDLDAARAHRAVHVAGPTLLAAMKNVAGLATYPQGIDRASPTDMAEDLEGILEAAAAAIAEAEPKKDATPNDQRHDATV